MLRLGVLPIASSTCPFIIGTLTEIIPTQWMSSKTMSFHGGISFHAENLLNPVFTDPMVPGMRIGCPAILMFDIAEPAAGAANFVLAVWAGFTGFPGTAEVAGGNGAVGAAAGAVACAARLFSTAGALGSLA